MRLALVAKLSAIGGSAFTMIVASKLSMKNAHATMSAIRIEGLEKYAAAARTQPSRRRMSLNVALGRIAAAHFVGSGW